MNLSVPITEVAWAAGFFDGEGSTNASTRLGRDGFKRLQCTISQVDRRTSDRFHKAVSCRGNILGPYGPYVSSAGNSPNCQPYYMIHWRKDAAEELLNLLWPYLSDSKKEQAKKARAEVKRRQR